MLQRSQNAVLLTMLFLVNLGCARIVSWASREKASWSFIQERCTPLKLGTISITDTKVAIPIEIGDKLDSAICMHRASARISANRILLTIKKGLCSGAKPVPLVAWLRKPQPGDYEIVYDDSIAGYPPIGKLHIN